MEVLPAGYLPELQGPEIRCAYPGHQGPFGDRYVAQENTAIWDGLEPLHQIANQIHGGAVLFQRLRVAQLIKHILGLKSQFNGTQNFELLYLWYPTPGPEAVEHEDEITRFREMTESCNPKIIFCQLKYQDLIYSMATAHGDVHGAYVDYLLERYF
jgi:hypothetical protein